MKGKTWINEQRESDEGRCLHKSALHATNSYNQIVFYGMQESAVMMPLIHLQESQEVGDIIKNRM